MVSEIGQAQSCIFKFNLNFYTPKIKINLKSLKEIKQIYSYNIIPHPNKIVNILLYSCIFVLNKVF